MSDVTSGKFSDYCFNAMWDYYNHHENEVGSEFRGDRRNRVQTNCVIYVYNVVSYGYAQLHRSDVVASLKAMFPRQDGMELSKYLVGQLWKAHYWNPDVYKPRDTQPEHIVSFKQALATRRYYGVDLSGLIVGYNKQDKFRTEHHGWIWPFGEDIKVSTEDPENLAVFEDLKKVEFLVGINRGGTHCFLMSYGDVLEVHWDKEGPAGLYGKADFYGYGWNSGILLTPPDSNFTSRFQSVSWAYPLPAATCRGLIQNRPPMLPCSPSKNPACYLKRATQRLGCPPCFTGQTSARGKSCFIRTR
jgi:hypothetical protein